MSLKCHNFDICNNLMPNWWVKLRPDGLCCNCSHMFGVALVKEFTTCIRCSLVCWCIRQPKCNHCLCPTCFNYRYDILLPNYSNNFYGKCHICVKFIPPIS